MNVAKSKDSKSLLDDCKCTFMYWTTQTRFKCIRFDSLID